MSKTLNPKKFLWLFGKNQFLNVFSIRVSRKRNFFSDQSVQLTNWTPIPTQYPCQIGSCLAQMLSATRGTVGQLNAWVLKKLRFFGHPKPHILVAPNIWVHPQGLHLIKLWLKARSGYKKLSSIFRYEVFWHIWRELSRVPLTLVFLTSEFNITLHSLFTLKIWHLLQA